jgi:AmmeMemoRadiSam system protein B
MIREAVVAGQFYPADPNELRATLGALIRKHDPLLEAKGVVVPHAGYVYSGSVAGEVFSSVRMPDRVILLGPNHTGRGVSLALAPVGAWDMPLGTVQVDADLNRELKAHCPELKEDAAAHYFEHSLEVQIPFLQFLQPDFQFSAICIQTIDLSTLEALGHAMAKVIQSRKESVLLIASSDMSHYRTREAAAKQDRFAIDQMLALDPQGLHRIVLKKDISMCGFAPAVAVLTACRDMGATKAKLIRYTDSGEASGDYDRVVAYAGIALI